MEGKILITKTFGLSQLIYNMQSYGFKDSDLKNTERILFKFIWSTNENQNGIDRISRAVLKNDYEYGGMKVTDVDCLNRAIKLRQFIRAHTANHIISSIQSLITGSNTIKQEYHKITDKEDICSSAQQTLNIITDHNREVYDTLTNDEFESDRNLINEVASLNLNTYLIRKGKMFIACILKQLTNNGVTTLAELIQANEYVKDSNQIKAIKLILGVIPKRLIEIAENYNEEINCDSENLKYILVAPNSRMAISTITVKQLQITLKVALKKIDVIDFNNKLGITNFEQGDILKFRNHCKNSKLRNIYHRLICRDFFTYARMYKYKMTDTDKCPRCSCTETINHLLWECTHARQIWKLYNKFISKLGNEQDSVKEYDNVYKVGSSPAIALVKIKVIQELIQIERPKNWNDEKMDSLVEELIRNERYIAKNKFLLGKFLLKWNLTN
jgi:hypothetical protein